MSPLDVLEQVRICAPTEAQVQQDIAAALTDAGIEFVREARLSSRDRIDFLVGGIGIEVKTQGSRAQIIRQLGRYAASEQVTELVLASTSRRILLGAPAQVLGVPVTGHLLQGALL